MKSLRRGKTLLEVAIVVAIMSVALMLSATTLVALFRLERQVRTSDAHRQAVARLASRLRADAHAAVAASASAGWELSLADGRTIQYTFTAPEITRQVRRGEEVLHRDAFVLAPQAEATFSVRADPAGEFVELTIRPLAPQQRRHQASIRPIALSAAVNLHGGAHAKEAGP
jgi:prepilin-type N-terminal cleavage/methylation domain-containing protein